MSEMPEKIVAWPDSHTCRSDWRPDDGTDYGGEEVHYVRADSLPQWQPIETAPEGGSILGWASGWAHPEVVVWDEKWRCWYDSDLEYGVTPSHWQPLPTPPL